MSSICIDFIACFYYIILIIKLIREPLKTPVEHLERQIYL